jgi:hypothetical protein
MKGKIGSLCESTQYISGWHLSDSIKDPGWLTTHIEPRTQFIITDIKECNETGIIEIVLFFNNSLFTAQFNNRDDQYFPWRVLSEQ